jgi:hypothetical protein
MLNMSLRYDSSNVLNVVASVDLHNLQLTWNLVEMGFDLGSIGSNHQ